jgi:HlyD family secretion protein
MKQNKILKIAGIVIVLLLVVVVVGRRAGWIGKTTGVRVTLEATEIRTITETVTASGKVQPVIEVKISPDVSGEVVELMIEEGDFVNRGDLLVQINPDIYKSALDRVEASLNTSRANLANTRARKAQAEAQFINAKAAFERSKSLYEQEAISESEFDTARSQFLVAQAEVEAGSQSIVAAEFQVKSAEATLREARENLTKTNIFAPMDGTVSLLAIELGERVVGTSQFTGTEIMRIANLNEMEVLVEVNENDIIRVNEGDTALIEIDAYLNQKFKGVVTSISNSALTAAVSVDQVTNFQVKIRVLTDSYKHLLREDQPHLSPFRPGMSASVDIQTNTAYNVMSVPIQAVTTRTEDEKTNQADSTVQQTVDAQALNEQIQEYVFVYYEEDGTVKLTPVISGVQDSNFIEIVSGLNDDDKVVTGPFRAISRELKDGVAVVVVSRNELFGEQ